MVHRMVLAIQIKVCDPEPAEVELSGDVSFNLPGECSSSSSFFSNIPHKFNGWWQFCEFKIFQLMMIDVVKFKFNLKYLGMYFDQTKHP